MNKLPVVTNMAPGTHMAKTSPYTSDGIGEEYLGVPGWLWGGALGAGALYGAYQLTKSPDKPKGALEPDSKPWLYKVNPAYWFKSGREKKFIGIEKERGVRNAELEKELTAAQRAYSVHQAASEKSQKVTQMEKEMTTSSGDAFVGAEPGPIIGTPQEASVLRAFAKAHLPLDSMIIWSPEQLQIGNQIVGSIFGGKGGSDWLQKYLGMRGISWADENGAIYSFSHGRVVKSPSMATLKGDKVTSDEVTSDEMGFNWKAALLTAGIAPALALTYKGGKALYQKIKGKKKSPEQQRQARMMAAYQKKAAALKKTRAMEKRHLAAIAVKEEERDIAEAEAQALESEAALQTAQAIALEAEATKDVPQIAEDLSGWSIMGGCPWVKAGPAHVAATNTPEGATLRRGLAAVRSARTNPKAREILLGITQKAQTGDVKSQQLLGTMKAGVRAETQLLGTYASNLAVHERAVQKAWEKVKRLHSAPRSAFAKMSGSVCGATGKKPQTPLSPDIASPIPGEPMDVSVAITAAAHSMGVPPQVAGSVVAAAKSGDKTARTELDQAQAVYRAAQKGDPTAKKAIGQVTKDAKSGYAPAAQKAAVFAAAVGLVKGRQNATKRQNEVSKKQKTQGANMRDYRIMSIKLSRYLSGTGPLASIEARRGYDLAVQLGVDAKGVDKWRQAFGALTKSQYKSPPWFGVGNPLGIFQRLFDQKPYGESLS